MKNQIAKFLRLALSIFLPVLVVSTLVYAGSLTPPSGTPTATSYTLNDIYMRLNTDASATAGNHLLSTTTTPAPSFHTLTEIYDAIPTIDPTKVLTGTTYLGVAGTASASSFGIPQTGQTLCYDPTGNTNDTVDCAGSGQDGEYQAGLAHNYTDNGDGTVTDNATGLMWVKCSEGQTGSDCSGGSLTFMDWSPAIAACAAETTGGYSDWRLPNVNELLSLVDYANPISGAVAIDLTAFPNTAGINFWSSTSFPSGNGIGADQAWAVFFDYTGMGQFEKNTAEALVRCVRG